MWSPHLWWLFGPQWTQSRRTRTLWQMISRGKMVHSYFCSNSLWLLNSDDSCNGIRISIQANPSISPHTSPNPKLAMKTAWTNLGTTFVAISSSMTKVFAVLMATLSADKSTTFAPMSSSTTAWSFSPVRLKRDAVGRSPSSRCRPPAPPKQCNPAASPKVKCATTGSKLFRAWIRAILSTSNSHRWARSRPLSVLKRALMMKMSHVAWKVAIF